MQLNLLTIFFWAVPRSLVYLGGSPQTIFLLSTWINQLFKVKLQVKYESRNQHYSQNEELGSYFLETLIKRPASMHFWTEICNHTYTSKAYNFYNKSIIEKQLIVHTCIYITLKKLLHNDFLNASCVFQLVSYEHSEQELSHSLVSISNNYSCDELNRVR